MYVTGEIKGYYVAAGKTRVQVSIDGKESASMIRKKKVKRIGVWLDDGRMISAEQRKKIYATIRDIAAWAGYTPEEEKQVLKYMYVARTGQRYFSLSDCSMDTARQFLNLILDICLEHGIPLSDALYERAEDIVYMLQCCLRHKKCAICGRRGEVHHWDAIGMGNDRRHYDDSENRKICLCREHHTLAHALGRERFAARYHVYGVYYVDNPEGMSKEESEDGRKGGADGSRSEQVRRRSSRIWKNA